MVCYFDRNAVGRNAVHDFKTRKANAQYNLRNLQSNDAPTFVSLLEGVA